MDFQLKLPLVPYEQSLALGLCWMHCKKLDLAVGQVTPGQRSFRMSNFQAAGPDGIYLCIRFFVR